MGRTEDQLAEDRRGPGAVEGDDRVRPAEPPPGDRHELSMKNRLHIRAGTTVGSTCSRQKGGDSERSICTGQKP